MLFVSFVCVCINFIPAEALEKVILFVLFCLGIKIGDYRKVLWEFSFSKNNVPKPRNSAWFIFWNSSLFIFIINRIFSIPMCLPCNPLALGGFLPLPLPHCVLSLELGVP